MSKYIFFGIAKHQPSVFSLSPAPDSPSLTRTRSSPHGSSLYLLWWRRRWRGRRFLLLLDLQVKVLTSFSSLSLPTLVGLEGAGLGRQVGQTMGTMARWFRAWCRIILLWQYKQCDRVTKLDGSTRDIEIYTVRGAVRAKPYSSGVAALVLVCSITGVVAPSYEVDWNGRTWIPTSRSLPSFI
jgi:hypothetical protein